MEVVEFFSLMTFIFTNGRSSLSLSIQPYQARLQQFRSKVGTDESTKISHSYFVDPDADVVTTTAPEFQNMEYENGITTVKGTSKHNFISKDKTVDFCFVSSLSSVMLFRLFIHLLFCLQLTIRQ